MGTQVTPSEKSWGTDTQKYECDQVMLCYEIRLHGWIVLVPPRSVTLTRMRERERHNTECLSTPSPRKGGNLDAENFHGTVLNESGRPTKEKDP